MLGGLRPKVEDLARSAITRSGKWPADGILVLAHGRSRKRTYKERLLHGIVLRRWDDSSHRLVPASDRAHAVIGDEDWEAQWWPAAPGCYVLGSPDGAHRAEQAVLVAKNSGSGGKWQTRVFLRETGEGSFRRTSLSIQMARHSSSVVYFDHYETIETARNALESGRPIVSQWLIQHLLGGKFDNPVMGLVGLHLFLSALEEVRAGKPSTLDAAIIAGADRVIDIVLGNLERLLGGAPPDLIALKVRAGRLKGAHVVNVTEPPMFWKSWDVLRRNTDKGEPVMIGREFWNRISLCAPAGPYFSWKSRGDSTAVPGRYAELSARVAAEQDKGRARVGLPKDAGFLKGDAFEIASAREGPTPLSVREMAQTLGVPLSAVVDAPGSPKPPARQRSAKPRARWSYVVRSLTREKI
jgi:hypothetical protein